MKEIVCPKCNTPFQVDDATYEGIAAQVRTATFNEEIEKRLLEVQEQFKTKEETLRLMIERAFEEKLADKVAQVKDLDKEITRLNGIIDAFNANKKSEFTQLESLKDKELNEAVNKKDNEIAALKAQLAGKDSEYAIKLQEEKNAGRELLQKKERELSTVVAEKEQALTKLNAEKEQELVALRAEIKAEKLTAENREAQLREQHKIQLQDKQEEIDRLKDFKLRLSTKMVGETLEQHCSITFQQAQCNGLYPYASFGKDNTAVEHSKGDFIFRDYIDGVEYISIMFEMKNEMDTTATKHRNDDFLEKLDKDRKRKNCEYAVLVSMLEQDNEIYNTGIVDKGYIYPKMLVIRPQFFMPLIRILTEAAKKGYMEKSALIQELEITRSQTRDFSKFEERINKFRDTFTRNVSDAQKKFKAATDGIDKAIEGLEKQINLLRTIKANFEGSEQKLLRANDYADEQLTVKKLTHGAPSVRKMIEEAE